MPKIEIFCMVNGVYRSYDILIHQSDGSIFMFASVSPGDRRKEEYLAYTNYEEIYLGNDITYMSVCKVLELDWWDYETY